ncbi:hypothetical protein SUGI_0525760 [Cryptomeria japonica]|uniref:uncharacterized protein LOC131029531 n=1 Tax=Cryptomeria japonica TaxID=3369 RepID=UPI002408AF67|nr:uncharacterized protein LOC131029531 [Cryptomeria japonica]GLJ26881.1 hypothetical protein SUGI_0525760 [Cryptomeria japonica]
MDRSEPTLVPEWLKGTSGGSAGSHHNLSASQSDNSDVQFSSRARPFQSQFPGPTRGDYDSFRNLGSSDRSSHLSFRRGLSNNSGGSERVNSDKDLFSNTRAYASFRRSSSFRSSDSAVEREKIWDWDRQREARDKEKSFGTGGNDRNIGREIPDSSRRWSSSGPDVKFDGELRRSRSVISNRKAEDEANKSGNELQSITMAPPIRGGLVSNIQKADFERNFPSLGAEERQGIQSNLVNVALLNSSSIWQGQRAAGRPDPGRTSSPGLNISGGSAPGTALSGVPAIGADGWKSALADVPVPNGVLQNSCPIVSDQQVTINSIVSKGHGLVSASGLNMAEALVQNPARPRTPQLSVEVQRLEELALKQSRQLIPVTPSMPKTMGLSPSEKSKAKSSRSIDTNASTVKATQSIGSSHLINSPKLSQGGKLVVLKQGREMGSSAVKTDSASPGKGGNTISNSFNSLAGGASDLGANLMGPRKLKLPADHRAISSVPTSSTVDGGLVVRHKEGSLVFEEKKSVLQAQKRSDFFNSLRKQSDSHTSTGTPDKSSSSRAYKADDGNEKVPSTIENNVELKHNSSLENEFVKPNIASSVVERTTAEKDKGILNGFISGQFETTNRDAGENDTSISTNMVSVRVGSEEEEAAFLRSLGWEENAGGEEALTEEEINSFYQELAANAFRQGNHRLWNMNVESMSS